MKISHILLTVVIAALASLGTAYVVAPKQGTATTAKASAYDRIKSSGTIRCGYAPHTGFLEKDPNTGELQGPFFDFVNALGKQLDLKVEWAMEVPWSDIVSSLTSEKFDLFCNGIYPNSARAREIDFTQPIYYNAVYAYARIDDTRFDNNLAALNDPSMKISAPDGYTAMVIANTDFPKAGIFGLPQMSSDADMFEVVATGKADATFLDNYAASQYIASNPGKVRQVPSARPVRVFPIGLALNAGEDKLRQMLDTATGELLNAGVVEQILQKHEKFPGVYLRIAPAYETAK